MGWLSISATIYRFLYNRMPEGSLQRLLHCAKKPQPLQFAAILCCLVLSRIK